MKIQGKVTKIIYHDETSGFTVAVIQRDVITSDTITGNFPAIAEGDEYELEGDWTIHPRYGKQFKAASYEHVMPETPDDIAEYLGSGIIKGVGPYLAGKIADAYGDEIFSILDNEPEKLLEIEGIGKKKIQEIRESWESQKTVKDVAIFLKKSGAGTALAAKIIKRYGSEAIEIIKENPYRLVDEVFGVGFVTADKIARNTGLAEDSPWRVEAGVSYTLRRLADDGHVYYPKGELRTRCAKFLAVDLALVDEALYNLANTQKIIIAEEPDDEKSAVYLYGYYEAETGSAELLKALAEYPSKLLQSGRYAKALDNVRENSSVELSDDQFDAVKATLNNKIMVITGGPGTGKTTIINNIINFFKSQKLEVLLAAPTGRAARRMAEASGNEARTIHRLLEFNPLEMVFNRDEEMPLETDLVIIDETSMVDILLFYSLLKAVPLHASLVFVGDADQLPSVGAGNVLSDLINSGVIHTVRLTRIFRQAEKSRIIRNAHLINQGKMPELEQEDNSDFYFVRTNLAETIVERVLSLVADDIPAKFGYDPYTDIQVISPMYRGTIGVDNLNEALQQRLNPDGEEVRRGNHPLRVNDKVMQIRNNYEKDVYNGDIGRIMTYDREQGKVTILFEEKVVTFELNELDEIRPAYAISVHKSQGSEYPVVIMPVVQEHYIMLQRKLIYTAVTRAKSLLMMLGGANAVKLAVINDKQSARHTKLSEWLKG